MTKSAAPIRVAICEDDTLTRLALEEQLTNTDGIAVVCTTGLVDDLVRLLEEAPADVVLVDLYQIREARFDAATLVRKVLPDAKVLCLTGSTFEGDVKRALTPGGFDGYLTKDITPAELVSAIHRLFADGAYVDPKMARALYMPSDLTDREVEVLQALADGLTREQLLAQLQWSQRTLTRNLDSAKRKIGAGTLAEAISIAHRRHYIH